MSVKSREQVELSDLLFGMSWEDPHRTGEPWRSSPAKPS